jgi:hypothetical protein
MVPYFAEVHSTRYSFAPHHHLTHTLERITSMRSQPVAINPWKYNAPMVQHATDLRQRRYLDWLTVAIKDIARHIINTDRFDQCLSHIVIKH